MKKWLALIIACMIAVSMLPAAVMAASETAVGAADAALETESSAIRDIDEYLWDLSPDMAEDEFELMRNRNYKIIKEMEPLFTEDSYHDLYAANVHLNQKREDSKEEFIAAIENLEQILSVKDGITFLWNEDNMPSQNNEQYTEEQLDASQRFGYGFVPYMINYLQNDPSQAKGNVLFFSGGGGDNGQEGFPTAKVFQDMGYNSFVVVVRKSPYTASDSSMDAARAVRMVKYLGEKNGWGGMDMIALCGFSAGGITTSDVVENQYGNTLPEAYGAAAYVPDEIDAYTNDINVSMFIYTGHDDPLAETGHWPAFFLCAGSEDGTGATQRLENYYEQVKDIVPSKLIVYQGAGHGFGHGGEGASNTTEEAAHWPEEADRFMQENLGYNQANTAEEPNMSNEDIQGTDDKGEAQDSSETVSDDAVIDSSFEIHTEDCAVTVEYYDGNEIVETREDGLIRVQVPVGETLGDVSIISSGGEINIIGVTADHYYLETVHDDMNVYLPEDTAFHVQLTTISDLFESDFMYDVTMQRHEYIYGDYENGVDIEMETIIGVARVMILQ